MFNCGKEYQSYPMSLWAKLFTLSSTHLDERSFPSWSWPRIANFWTNQATIIRGTSLSSSSVHLFLAKILNLASSSTKQSNTRWKGFSAPSHRESGSSILPLPQWSLKSPTRWLRKLRKKSTRTNTSDCQQSTHS